MGQIPVILCYLALGAALGAAAATALLAPDQGVLAGIFLAAACCFALVTWLARREAASLRAKTDPIIQALPVPAAVFDAKDRMVTCNQPFRARFRKALQKPEAARRTAMTYTELVAGALEKPDTAASRKASLQHSLDVGPDVEQGLHDREFPDLGWLRLGRGSLPGGGSVRVLVDIDRLKRREAELSQSLDAATAADEAKGRFLSTVSHELRTPLQGVIGMVNLLKTGDLSDQARRNVEVIGKSGRHLLDLINQILMHSTVEHGGQVYPLETFDIGALVDEVIAETEHAPEARGLLLEAWFEGDVPPIRRGDRRGLRQVLTNLVGNAVKFTEQGSVSVIVSQSEAGMLRLVVADTGIGIPHDKQAEIFEAFSQIDSSLTRRHTGTGLGLTICAGLIDRMGATMEIESEVGEGSRFILDLPMPKSDGTSELRAVS